MKKASFLVISLILVMGTLGVGFAFWQQGLTVNGTVETGFIAANFSAYDVTTDDRPYSATSALIPNLGHTDAAGNLLKDVLEIKITDAYPGFHQKVWFQVTNNGTVPFYLDDIVAANVVVRDNGPIGALYNPIPAPGIINIVVDALDQGYNTRIVEPTATSGWYAFTITIPGDASDGPGGFWLDPNQHWTYTLTIPMMAHQQPVP